MTCMTWPRGQMADIGVDNSAPTGSDGASRGRMYPYTSSLETASVSSFAHHNAEARFSAHLSPTLLSVSYVGKAWSMCAGVYTYQDLD